LIEGENAVDACAKSGNLVEVYCTKDYLQKTSILENILKISKLKINLISEKTLEKITETDNPAGIVGVSKTITKIFEKDSLNNKNFIVLLFDISDPGNVGTILRSADAFGVDLVVLVGKSVDISNGKIVRSSAGSIFNVEIRNSDIENTVDILKSFNGNIYQTRTNQELTLTQVDLAKPLIWIFGNEAHGLKDFPINIGANVSIPMLGKTESLNVSTAATLCMYETAKTRSIK
jgi:TrmH family RNA methyltransferase